MTYGQLSTLISKECPYCRHAMGITGRLVISYDLATGRFMCCRPRMSGTRLHRVTDLEAIGYVLEPTHNEYGECAP